MRLDVELLSNREYQRRLKRLDLPSRSQQEKIRRLSDTPAIVLPRRSWEVHIKGALRSLATGTQFGNI